MFGVGPGQLASDAAMLGIQVDEQRRMMEESFDVIMALFRGEVVTAKTDWFTHRRGPPADAPVLELRHRRRRVDLAVGPEARRPPRRRPALGRRDQPGRLREPRRPLEGDGGAGRRGRPHRRPLEVADDGPDAHRRDRGAGARRLPLRARAGHGLPRPRRPDPADRGDELRGPGQGDERDRLRRRRHAGHGDRPDPAAHRPVRRLRRLPRVRRRPRRLAGDAALLRADRPVRDAALPGPARAAAGVLRLDRRHRPHVRQADARRDRQVPPGVRRRARRSRACRCSSS